MFKNVEEVAVEYGFDRDDFQSFVLANNEIMTKGFSNITMEESQIKKAVQMYRASRGIKAEATVQQEERTENQEILDEMRKISHDVHGIYLVIMTMVVIYVIATLLLICIR